MTQLRQMRFFYLGNLRTLLLLTICVALGCDRSSEKVSEKVSEQISEARRPEGDTTKSPQFQSRAIAENGKSSAGNVPGTLVPVDAHQSPTHPNSIVVGIDADMSSVASKAGAAIYRGVMLAVDDINEAGGTLGRKWEVVVRDHRGNPARGIDHISELAAFENLAAVIGGVHSPVAIAQLPAIHEHEVLFLAPWSAATKIVSNDYSPNYVFRVSVRDEYAGRFLVSSAIRRGAKRIAILLERTQWGRSNQDAISKALQDLGMEPVSVEWFHWGETNLRPQVEAAIAAEAQVLLLVANTPEGVAATKAMASLPKVDRIPLISHWGILGGDFADQAKEVIAKVDLTFLQTHSFLRSSSNERSQSLIKRYCDSYDDASSARDIIAPTGTAHAYELMQMLAQATEAAQSTERSDIRQALEQLKDFRGVIRDYPRPFRPEHHDALTIEDFTLAKFDEDGTVAPTASSREDAGMRSKGRSNE